MGEKRLEKDCITQSYAKLAKKRECFWKRKTYKKKKIQQERIPEREERYRHAETYCIDGQDIQDKIRKSREKIYHE